MSKINKLPRLCQISKFFDLSNFAFRESRNKNLEEEKVCPTLIKSLITFLNYLI